MLFRSPSGLTVFNGQLYFNADDGSSGEELWRYDGTNAPQRVTDLNPGIGDADPTNLTVFNGQLYFNADDGNTGKELWRYDGTNPLQQVADLNPGSGDADPTNLAVFDNQLYFSADDGSTGTELWRYDGTNAPQRVTDLNPGTDPNLTSGNADPTNLQGFNGQLYFRANDGTNGTELWTYKPQSLPTPAGISNGSLSLQFAAPLTGATPQTDLTTTMSNIPLGSFFDERYYLSQYQDVAQAVAAGDFATGYDHFVAIGLKEGRNPIAYYSEADYLANNIDVKEDRKSVV